MSVNEIHLLLQAIVSELQALNILHGQNNLQSIIKKYQKTLDLLTYPTLDSNPIKTSLREYLEIYSDYENPLLEKMDLAQKQIQLLIERRL